MIDALSRSLSLSFSPSLTCFRDCDVWSPSGSCITIPRLDPLGITVAWCEREEGRDGRGKEEREDGGWEVRGRKSRGYAKW
jgi:hypothetical protein